MANFQNYKGRPIVRSGDTIYYGSMKKPFVAKLDIKTKKDVKDMKVADRISIQILATDPTTPPAKMIAKRGEANGLYEAIDIASVWLDKSNA